MSARTTRSAAASAAEGSPSSEPNTEPETEAAEGGVEEELEVAGGTDPLASAQAAETKATAAAKDAADQVAALQKKEKEARELREAAEKTQQDQVTKLTLYNEWIKFVEDDGNSDELVKIERYWKLIDRYEKAQERADVVARQQVLDEQRRADLARQDKRDATQAALIADLQKKIEVLENGSKPDEEPAFREFAARAPDNLYGELRQSDPTKVFHNEPKLQSYDTLSSGNRDPGYDKSAKGRTAAQVARHSNLTKDLSVAESLCDAIGEIALAFPELEACFKGKGPPGADLAEDSDEYIALTALSRTYNTLRAVHDNILQPAINYHQVWPLVYDFVSDKTNGLKESDGAKIMSCLEGPIAGKAFGGQTLPASLSAAWKTAITGMEAKSSEKLLKNLAAAQANSPRTPFARSESSGSIGSTYESRRRAAAYADRSPAPGR
jgi:hypothetical protein